MDWYKKNINPENEHSYKLHDGIYLTEKNSVSYLIRKNPLTTITLEPTWTPLLNLLNQGEYISFNEVCANVNADPAKTEIFLNSLVRKGFLESRGYRPLSDYPSCDCYYSGKKQAGGYIRMP
jgi:hypothetical protein